MLHSHVKQLIPAPVNHKKLRKMIRNLLAKQLFKIGKNARYKYSQLMELVTSAALSNRSIENQSEIDGNISADDLFHHLQKLVVNEITKLLQHQLAAVRRLLKSSGLALGVIVAIDKTEVSYWGEHEKNQYVTGGQRKNSTNWAFRYLTATIAINGQEFIIYVRPLTKADNDDALLVEECILALKKQGFNIKRVLLDREFYNADLIFALNVHEVEYIIPAVKNSKFEELIRKLKFDKKKLPIVEENYSIKEQYTNLVIYEDTDKDGKTQTFGFITNVDAEVIAKDVYAIVDEYKNRWCIENAHKFQDQFELSTNSTDGVVRFFFFMIGVLFHNFWVLLNLLGNTFGIGEIPLNIMRDIVRAAYGFAATPHYKHPQRELWVKILLGRKSTARNTAAYLSVYQIFVEKSAKIT